MKTLKIVCFIACIILLGFHVYSLDFEDLSFKTNRSPYLGILAMTLVGLSFLLRIIKDRKNKG
jgi:hypothetical protein